jgi:hypothetical protein
LANHSSNNSSPTPAPAAQQAQAHSEKAGYRVQLRMGALAGSILGIGGPAATAINRFEYLQHTADRLGVSIGQMALRFGPFVAAGLAATAIMNKAAEMGKEADESWTAAGAAAQGFWKNLAIGYGLIEGPKITATINYEELGAKIVEQHMTQIKTWADEITHKDTPAEATAKKFAPEEKALQKRRAAVGQYQEAEDKIRAIIAGVESGKEMMPQDKFDNLKRILKDLKTERATLNEQDINKDSSDLQAREKKDVQGRAAAPAEAEKKKARQAAIDKEIADRKSDLDKKDAADRADRLAGLRAIAEDKSKPAKDRIAATRAIAEEEKKNAGKGAAALIDVQTKEKTDKLAETAEDKESKTEKIRPADKINVQADQLARIGYFVGQRPGQGTTDYGRKTAEALERLERDGVKIKNPAVKPNATVR